MPSLRKLRAGRIAGADASTWVGEYGTIFYNEATGTLRISDGHTPGGNPLTLVSSDFQFQFGDFVADTGIGAHGDTAAYLSSLNTDEDIILQSNGAGGVGVIGEFAVWPPDGPINTREPIFRISDDGQTRILVSAVNSTSGAVNIVGSTSGLYQSPVNTGVMLHLTGNLNVPSRFYNDAQGAFAAFVARRYNGFAASPTAVLDGEEILRISGTAHNGTSLPGSGNQRILYKALGNQTLTNQGGTIELWTTPQNTTTIAKVASVDNVNGITSIKFTGPLTGDVTGNVSGTAGSVAAANITGTTLANNVVTSSLTTIGTLTNLTVAGTMRYDIASNNTTVTQGAGADKSVTVTCNGRTGQITTNNASIAKGSSVTFTVNNSSITTVTDVVVINIQSGATINSYAISVTRVQVGSFNITLTNNGVGPLTDTIVINFAVIKVS